MQNKTKQLVYIIFPLIIHFALSELLYIPFYLGTSLFRFRLKPNYILMQNLLTCCISIPVFLYMHQKDQQRPDYIPAKSKKHSLFFYAGLLLFGAASSQLLNSLIMLSPLPKFFPGYANTFSSILDSHISIPFAIWTILAAPLSEELLFRLLVFKRLRAFYSARVSILVSALLFGFLHGNMLQFVYALLLGILLAWLLEYSESDAAPVLFHIGANLWSLIITLIS